jgi:hypothetical protein
MTVRVPQRRRRHRPSRRARTSPALAGLACLAALLVPADAARAQQGGAGGALGTGGTGGTGGGARPGPGQNVSREAMWPAPTAADWARPCLVRWQRTWDDAVALSRETEHPILVCVNMDGEIASEHYAGIRYRQPEIAALYEPYVCVIASVYRHSPRDYDEEGRRVPCPRFGTVTCGEHIAIEPVVYGLFLDEVRVAPRHIMVELDGSEQYDVYYAWDTDSVFAAIRKGIEERPGGVPEIVRGDRSLAERVASPDSADREAVEAAWLDGDRARRRELLQAALALGADAPLDLLRLAVFGLDLELARTAREALTRATDPGAVDLITEALRVPMDAAERDALVAALVRLGTTDARARALAVVQRGLSQSSRTVDAEAWGAALGGATYAAPEDVSARRTRVAARVEAQDTVLQGEDAGAHLELAESFLQSACDHADDDPEYARLLFLDALRTARDAEALGAGGWRLDAAVAVSAYYTDDRATAWSRAEAAMAGGLPEAVPDWNAMAVLAIFAQARQEAIQAAVREQRDWPPEWLTDVDAAYAVLARHPFGTPDQIVAHYDFLNWLAAPDRSKAVLERGLARFPDAPALHERLRRHALWEHGVRGLEPAYERLLVRPDAPAILRHYAGLASVLTAELRRRRGRDDEAGQAYARALAHFEAAHTAAVATDAADAANAADAGNAADRASAATGEEAPDRAARVRDARQVALVHGALARLAYEAGDDERAVDELLASFERDPRAAAVQDGLNISPADTARMLRARLDRAGRQALRDRLDAALAALAEVDPTLLDLPAYERQVAPPPRQPARQPAGPDGGS